MDLVEAMPEILAARPHAKLVVAGDGEELARLRARARDLNVSHACRFLGWVDPAHLRTLTRIAAVCAIPHRVCEHTETTYPNKLLEFMALGKAVVVSPCRPMMRIVGEHPEGPAGLVAHPRQWGTQIIRLLEDAHLRMEFGARGQALVESTYNAKVDQARLLEVFESLSVR